MRPSSSIKSKIYVWQGLNASDDVVQIAVHLCQRMFGVFSSSNSVETLKSGQECSEFWRFVSQDGPHDPAIHPTFDDHYDIRSLSPTTAINRSRTATPNQIQSRSHSRGGNRSSNSSNSKKRPYLSELKAESKAHTLAFQSTDHDDAVVDPQEEKAFLKPSASEKSVSSASGSEPELPIPVRVLGNSQVSVGSSHRPFTHPTGISISHTGDFLLTSATAGSSIGGGSSVGLPLQKSYSDSSGGLSPREGDRLQPQLTDHMGPFFSDSLDVEIDHDSPPARDYKPLLYRAIPVSGEEDYEDADKAGGEWRWQDLGIYDDDDLGEVR